jgi:hypothetical protein
MVSTQYVLWWERHDVVDSGRDTYVLPEHQHICCPRRIDNEVSRDTDPRTRTSRHNCFRSSGCCAVDVRTECNSQRKRTMAMNTRIRRLRRRLTNHLYIVLRSTCSGAQPIVRVYCSFNCYTRAFLLRYSLRQRSIIALTSCSHA